MYTKGGTYMYTKETGFKQSFSSDMKLSAWNRFCCCACRLSSQNKQGTDILIS